MKEHSRIRFNPITKEIEIEGSEKFVKAYFKKLQEMISGATKGEAIKAPKAEEAAPTKKAEKKAKVIKNLPLKKAKKATKKDPGEKRVTNIDMIMGLILESAEGISTVQLKEKTGLAERQIWNTVTRATKEGKIRKVKRGIYSAAG